MRTFLIRLACFSAVTSLALTPPAHAADATWLANPGSADFNTAANWTPAAVPDGIATFNASTTQSLAFSATTSLAAMQFNADGYTLNAHRKNLTLTGSGVGGASSASILDFTNLEFDNASSAGNSVIAVRQGSSLGEFGALTFHNTSTAGAAQITNRTVEGTGDSGGQVYFYDSSSAGSATITNQNTAQIAFNNNSTAGNATIVNQGSIIAGVLVPITFRDASSAGNANISGGFVQFLNNSTAGNARLQGPGILFKDNASAGTATLIIDQLWDNPFSGTGATSGQPRAVFSNSALLDISSGAVAAVQLGSIEGMGNIAIGNATLTVGANNLSTTFTGVICDRFIGACAGRNGSGTGNFVKTGTGTLTIAGTLAAQGSITISGGALQIGDSFTSGVLANDVVDNASLIFGGSNTNIVVHAGRISGTGSVTVAANLTLTNVANSYSGGTLIPNGSLAIGSDGELGAAAGQIQLGGPLTVGVLQLANGTVVGVARTIILNGTGASGGNFAVIDAPDTAMIASTITGGGTFYKEGRGTLILTGANTYTGPTRIENGALQIASNNALGATGADLFVGVNGGGGTLRFGSTMTLAAHPLKIGGSGVFDTQGFTDTITQDISQDGISSASLVKEGSGTLVLTGTGNYAGGVSIRAGTLQVGNGGTTGKLGTGPISDNGALVFNRSDTVTVNDAIIGAGTLTQAGSGTLILTGSVSIDKVVINQGTITVKNSGCCFLAANIVDNSALVFSSPGMTFNYDISGSGSVRLIGEFPPGHGLGGIGDTANALFTLGGKNTYSGATVVQSGTLVATDVNQFSPNSQYQSGTLDLRNFDQTVGSISGSLTLRIGTATLTAGGDGSSTSCYCAFLGSGGFFASTGGFTKAGSGSMTLLALGVNVYSGATTVSGGTLRAGGLNAFSPLSTHTVASGAVLDANSFNQTIGGLAGAGSVMLGSAALTVGGNGTSTVFAGVISGSGSLVKTGAGKLTLSGNNSFGGITTINAGTLQIGDGGTTGSVVGNILDNGVLTFNSIGAASYAGVISGSGAVRQEGAGTLTLSGANTYAGGTVVAAGQLNVIGTIGAVTVASSASLAGTGTIGDATVQGGGTIAPGTSGIGTLAVSGNMALNSGGIYAVDLSSTTADRITASGSASLGGALVATAASGSYSPGQSYTLVSAAGGVSGTFSTFTISGLPRLVKGRLAYDANDAYLVLDAVAIAPTLPSGTSALDLGVAGGIDHAIQGGAMLSTGFQSLFGLDGAQLVAALDQISGKGAADTASAVGQGMSGFMLLLQGQGGDTGSFAPSARYGTPDAPRPANLGPGTTRIWGQAFGGHADISGDAAAGSASLASNNYGFAAGAELGVTNDLLLGIGGGIGRQDFAAGAGTGNSDDVMIGGYVRQNVMERGYLAGSIGYGIHDIATTRAVTVSGTDILGADYQATDLGWRVESGWQLASDTVTATPFIAFAGDRFLSPAYSEHARSGSSTFALSYTSSTTRQSQSELGVQIDHGFVLQEGALKASLRGAWAHQLDNAPMVIAAVQSLAGSSFQLLGVRAAMNTALLGGGLDWERSDGLAAGIHVHSQMGPGTTIIQGIGTLSWQW